MFKCKIQSIDKGRNISKDNFEFKVRLECNGMAKSKYELINKLKIKDLEIE